MKEDAEYTVEYKFDGLTMCLTYEDGKFVRATTRGNGVEGEDVTAQVLTIKSYPLSIPYKGVLKPRGRRSSAFPYSKSTTARPAEPSKTRAMPPRARCATSIPPSPPQESGNSLLRRELYVRGFALLADGGGKISRRAGLQDLSPYKLCKTPQEVKDAIAQIDLSRKSIDVLTDGAVVKVNDFAVREALGYTDKFPRWAIAFKFEAEEAVTTVRKVTWQVGRTGKLTPLAEVDPVELAGATVRKATLNNLGDIRRKDIKIGSKVLIRRSNEVIPEILGAYEHTGESIEVNPPAVCPYCGAPVEEVGANLFCTNRECRPRIVAQLANFASKGAMDIEGFSEMTAELFAEKLHVRRFSDLYVLDKKALSGLEGFGDKKISNLLSAIAASKNVPLDKFIFALGIDGIGKVASRDLAQRFGSLEGLENATVEQLVEMENIGEKTAQNIVRWFADEENRAEVSRLLAEGVTPVLQQVHAGGIFAGQNVVLTGTLSRYKRSEAQKLIEDEGGVCQSAVTSKTTLVVAGESAGSKLDKAKALGVRIIGEEEFVKMLTKG